MVILNSGLLFWPPCVSENDATKINKTILTVHNYPAQIGRENGTVKLWSTTLNGILHAWFPGQNANGFPSCVLAEKRQYHRHWVRSWNWGQLASLDHKIAVLCPVHTATYATAWAIKVEIISRLSQACADCESVLTALTLTMMVSITTVTLYGYIMKQARGGLGQPGICQVGQLVRRPGGPTSMLK